MAPALGYVLENKVTHIRLLPTTSKHSFVYPTISLLLSLDALERHQLNIWRGWLFSYGGIWGRVMGLRPSTYLYDSPRDKRTIKQKLEDILEERGWPGFELQDAWLMTMPSLMGYEGINPLSVYFCYRRGDSNLWLVVLETHNTFGERHVDVLDTAKGDELPQKSRFDHQWTFPRQFHVSPFNDRSGHYICQVTAPSHPPCATGDVILIHPPCPTVKITLLTAPPYAHTKLVAVLRPRRSAPLTGGALLKALIRAPFGLLLSFPRILYQAFILHYHKRLDVYQRPEPRASDPALEALLPAEYNAVQPIIASESAMSGGIGWQAEGFLESWCKHRVLTFLRKRCAESRMSVTLVSSNSLEGRTTIHPPTDDGAGLNSLFIYFRSPRLYTTLFMMPSPQHALLYGSQAEKIFTVSSETLFFNAFATTSATSSMAGRLMWHIRRVSVPPTLDVFLPSHHPLDEPTGLVPVFVLFMLWLFATLEEKILTFLGARFVPGYEPWGGWDRLRSAGSSVSPSDLGSVRREHMA